MQTKVDLFGSPVAVGDWVGINPPSYKGLVAAQVLKLTPKGFTVKYLWQNHFRETNVPQVVKASK